MESTYENNNESFKKFLADFCTNVIVQAEESDDLPFRLTSKQLTSDEVEAESLEWASRYLQKYNCPHTLSAAISRTVGHTIKQIDFTDFLHEDTKEKAKDENNTDIIAEDKPIVLDPNKVCCAVVDSVHDVCKKWKEVLPDLPPPERLLFTCTHEIKNTRRKMEDRHVVLPDLNTLYNLNTNTHRSFFAVFDGHAGLEAAVYAAAHVPHQFVNSTAFPKDPVEALKSAFKSTDEKFIEKASRERLKSGSTGVLAYIEDSKLYISWLGDSQAVLVRNGQAVKVMEPHKPEREDEQARIEALGGCILYMGTWRVNGNLAVSRAIGDLPSKKFISSDADTTTIDLDGTEDYVILACDGLWDVVNYDKAVEIVYEYVQSVNGDLSGVAKNLVLTAENLGSSDNITVTVVFFKNDISAPQIPQLFDFAQGETDSNNSNSPDEKGDNSDQNDKGDNSDQNEKGGKSDNQTSGNQENNMEQSEFISITYDFPNVKDTNSKNRMENKSKEEGKDLNKPTLTRNEPVFIIGNDQSQETKKQVPIKVQSKNNMISGFRRQFETISMADLRDYSVEPSVNDVVKIDSNKNEDYKENNQCLESDGSFLSGYLTNSKHSEPYYNKSMFSEKKKHHSHRRRKKEKESNETETKRSRRHRELSPIVWNYTGTAKPSVNNYKLTYTKQISSTTPRYSMHSHLSETPITVRTSLPDLSSLDKYKSPRTVTDYRQTDHGAITVNHSFDSSPFKESPSLPHLPKIKTRASQNHSSSNFSSSWRPKRMAKVISRNMTDVPPSPLDSKKMYYERQL